MQPVIAANGLIEQVVPGSFATWRSEGNRPVTTASGDRIVCVIGTATGGAPNEPYLFTQNDQNLTRILQSGELLQATRFALANGVGGVVAINPAPGTPATFTMVGDPSGTFGTISTAFFREPANQTRFLVSGNAADGYSVEITNSLTGTNIASNRVGLGLYVQYTGGGQAELEIVDVGGVRLLRTTVTGADAEDLEIPLTNLTVADLIRRVQESGPYTALYARDARLDANSLDLTATPVAINAFPRIATVSAAAKGATSLTVTALSRAVVKGETLRVRVGNSWVPVRVEAAAAQAATTLTVAPVSAAIPAGNLFGNQPIAPKGLSAVKADFKLFFDTKAAGAATFTPGAAAKPAAQSGYFTGAATLAPAPEDWAEAAQAAIDAFPFGTAVALQDDRGISFGLRAVFQQRRHPRHSSPVQFFEGLPEYILPTGTSAAEIAAFRTEVANEIASVNDRDSVVVIQRLFGNLTPSGVTGRESVYMAALRAAVARAAVGPGNSLTYVTVGGTDPQPRLTSEANAFVLAGALVFESPRKNDPARVILGRTAYVGEDDLAYESEKTVCIMNALTRAARAIGEATVPGAGSLSKLADYKRNLESYYQTKVEAGWLTAGVDANGEAVEPFEVIVQRTSYQGRKATAITQLNPTPELLMTDHELVARTVEIEVTA